MKNWINHAQELLLRSLEPVPQELNQLDWKLDLSQKEERFHHHLSVFANYEGGGYLVFGIDRNTRCLMIQILFGDIFNSRAQTLVNTVNCVGVMGKGLALAFKNKYADMFSDYEQKCKQGLVQLGKPYLYKSLFPPFILLFPTKDHWRSVSNIHAIEEGLQYLKKNYKDWGITSIAVPPLGCGLGELDWNIVGPTLYRHLKDLDIEVELYAPFGTPHKELIPEFLGEQNKQHISSPSPQSFKKTHNTRQKNAR